MDSMNMVVLSMVVEPEEMKYVIKCFEAWLYKINPFLNLDRTMDGIYPVYEEQLAIIMFGAFLQGYESKE